MLIQKGGISRDIPKEKLFEYSEKGFSAVSTEIIDAPEAPETPEETKNSFSKLTKDELLQKATELGIDLSDSKTNKEKAEKLFEATKPKE